MRNRHRALPAWLGWYPFDAPRPKQVPAGRSQQTSIIGVVLGPPEPRSPDRARGRQAAHRRPPGPAARWEGTHNLLCVYLAIAVIAGSSLHRLRVSDLGVYALKRAPWPVCWFAVVA